MSDRKLQVGDDLWFVGYERYVRDQSVVVKKVGRKWAEISNGHRIDVSTFCADGRGCRSPGRCYLTKEDHDAEIARQRLWEALRAMTRGGIPSGVTAAHIQQAIDLISKPAEVRP